MLKCPWARHWSPSGSPVFTAAHCSWMTEDGSMQRRSYSQGLTNTPLRVSYVTRQVTADFHVSCCYPTSPSVPDQEGLLPSRNFSWRWKFTLKDTMKVSCVYAIPDAKGYLGRRRPGVGSHSHSVNDSEKALLTWWLFLISLYFVSAFVCFSSFYFEVLLERQEVYVNLVTWLCKKCVC